MFKPIIFSDLNQELDNDLLKGLEPIYQSIYNLLNTIPGERINLPQYGINLEIYRFKLFSENIGDSIFNEITNKIEIWEPRVEIDYSLSKYILREDSHEYFISIVFKLKNATDQLYVLNNSISTLSKFKDRFNIVN